jgi:hypothetical protein
VLDPRNSAKHTLFVGPCPHRTVTIAFNPTFGSFTLLKPVFFGESV